MAEDKNKPKKLEGHLTPEEKLFQVIAAGNKDYHITQSDPEMESSPDLQEPDPFSRLEAFWNRVKDFFSNKPDQRAGKQVFQNSIQKYFSGIGAIPAVAEITKVKNINRFLIGVLALLGAYLMLDVLFLGDIRISQFMKFAESKNMALDTLSDSPGPVIPDLSHYLEPANTRNLFTPLEKHKAVTETGEMEAFTGGPPPVKLKLVGISWDKQGFVAMVEREGQNAAIFVRQGDTLEAGFKVKKITEQALTYTNGRDEWELA